MLYSGDSLRPTVNETAAPVYNNLFVEHGSKAAMQRIIGVIMFNFNHRLHFQKTDFDN